ncbi:FkbM family methyltransferase [Candidatus Pelagibacter sp. FZCC0015]|uniref:FkbM family methyltransferase n=1 Tax=Candidatus Pelagibacter sp. FZCC0015 TaxID=2268451 RepID=UPI0011A1E2FB|nr:FkbM family methyltransferase [Candidatus Pelagibacter sp. FZCC0015]
MYFVHLGAGAGDQDSRANFRCGFTEFIKKKYDNKSKVFVVEANKLNIEKLKFCYRNYKNINIHNIAISTKNLEELTFYYAKDDAPHFQVCSSDFDHVKKNYPNSDIEKFTVKSFTINNFFENNSINEIDYLSIDIEGLDFEVIMSIDFSKYNIKNISIEYLHLTKNQKKKLISFLTKSGYSYCGFGYDHNNFDYLFCKKKIFWNRLLSKLIHRISIKHYKILNNFLLNN